MPQKPFNDRSDELRFTQNFLRDPALVDRIVALAQLKRGDTVLEIGPGKGIITRKLADVVTGEGQVIAVELDGGLATSLTNQFRQLPQVKIVNMDFLRFGLGDLPPGYAAFANVPFNITSALLEHLFDASNGPAQAHLILQKETLIGANERGANAETFKSMMIKPLYRIELAHQFLKSDFVPQPSVETALFAFAKRDVPLVDPVRYDLYKDFLAVVSKDRAGEGAWRALFSAAQMGKLADQAGLIVGRGLKSQSVEAISGAFQTFLRASPAKQYMVKGAMAALREEQERREQINRAGGHRRPQ